MPYTSQRPRGVCVLSRVRAGRAGRPGRGFCRPTGRLLSQPPSPAPPSPSQLSPRGPSLRRQSPLTACAGADSPPSPRRARPRPSPPPLPPCLALRLCPCRRCRLPGEQAPAGRLRWRLVTHSSVHARPSVVGNLQSQRTWQRGWLLVACAAAAWALHGWCAAAPACITRVHTAPALGVPAGAGLALRKLTAAAEVASFPPPSSRPPLLCGV